MTELEREAERLAWLVLRANRYRFGRSTDKLSREELEQLLQGLGGDPTKLPPDAEPNVPAPGKGQGFEVPGFYERRFNELHSS